MKIKSTYKLLNIVTVIAVTMFFSCNNSLKEVQDSFKSDNEPVGIAENFNLKYTDSGRVTASLISSKMLDYSNRAFSFYEFIDGAALNIFDKENNKSIIVADYAIVYNSTSLIDLQGNVVITTSDGNVLKTEQLFYDKKKDWLFTNEPFSYEKDDDVSYGIGFDSNSKFTNVAILEMDSTIILED